VKTRTTKSSKTIRANKRKADYGQNTAARSTGDRTTFRMPIQNGR
jgi:hypothetical protein